MKATKSTIKQPLKYIEYVLLNDGLKHIEESFFEYWLEKKQKSPKSINILPDRVLVGNKGEAGTTETLPFLVLDEINGKLRTETLVAIENISEAVAEITFKNESPDLFLSVQANLLNRIYQDAYPVLKEFPFVVQYLNDILTQINSCLIENEKYSLLDVISGEDGGSLVNELFEFLIKRDFISPDEYKMLFVSINKFLDNYESKNLIVDKKVDIKDENKSLVRFCFYLLQKAQPKSRGTKQYFIDFIKHVIVNFEQDSSLSNHFSEPPNELFDWYPDRVKNAMQKET